MSDPKSHSSTSKPEGVRLTLEVGRPWLVTGWALFIFVMGAIAGGAAYHLWRPKPPRDHVSSPLPRDFARRMQHDLQLSDQQANKVEEIVTKYEPRFKQTSHEAREKLRDHLEEMNQEILPLLDGAQREMHEDEWQRILWRPHKGPDHKGPGFKGPGFKGPGHKGPGFKGPGHKGPGFKGPVHKGPGHEGPFPKR